VQQAVNRVQSEDETKLVIDAARAHGFKSVSVDLIYGLPKQNVISFNRTLEQILALSPDRLSIYNYAHLPSLFKPQRRIMMPSCRRERPSCRSFSSRSAG
jgi:oxygen-independent coproporphyrinogen-3 oxidase